jgi:hypothetical protein
MARNKFIKKPHVEMEYTPWMIQELRKCKNNPIYFIETYVKIVHPTKGAVHFHLYDYQKELVRCYHTKGDNIVLSARQTGKSITSSAYILWFTIFKRDKQVLIASNKEKGAKEMIARIRYAYEHLPMWLKPGITDDGWNKFSIIFDNGSKIDSSATSEDSGRGMSISLLYLDEFAFVAPNIAEEFWTAIAPTLSTGGDCIITSTPNGDMNLFAQLWRGAELDVNGFHPTWVKWDQPPGRDEEFKKKQIGKIGERKWLQEYECEFLSSDALLINSQVLITETKRLEKIKPIKEIHDVKFWKNIIKGKNYLIGVDPATGSGEDFSVISGFDFPEMEQVFEFRSNSMSSPFLYKVLKNIMRYIKKHGGNIYFSVENNGVGEGIIALYEADEKPIDDVEFVSEDGAKRRGITTTNKKKIKACVNFKEMFEKIIKYRDGRTERTLTINSITLVKELKSFARKRGSYAAQIGATDDCILSVLIILSMLEEIATYDEDAYNKLHAFDNENWFENEDGYDETNADDQPLPIII